MNMKREKVTLDSGVETTIGDLLNNGPLALIFLRHYGCTFCRAQVAEFRSHPNLNLIFVGMGDLNATADFKDAMQSPHRFISDPDQILYQMAGVPSGNMLQLFGPTVAVRGLRRLREGYGLGMPHENPWKLGATVIMDENGEVIFNQPARDAGDVVCPEELIDRLNSARSLSPAGT